MRQVWKLSVRLERRSANYQSRCPGIWTYEAMISSQSRLPTIHGMAWRCSTVMLRIFLAIDALAISRREAAPFALGFLLLTRPGVWKLPTQSSDFELADTNPSVKTSPESASNFFDFRAVKSGKVSLVPPDIALLGAF